MTPAAFSLQARSRAAIAGEMLLALEAEFRPVDADGVDAALRLLAEPFGHFGDVGRRPVRAETLLTLIEGFRSRGDDDPRNLMLTTAIYSRAGHPMVLAVLIQEAARRVGVPLVILGGQRTWAVGDARFDPAVLIDAGRREPWPPTGRGPELLQPKCAHQVAFALTARLANAFALHGDLRRAIQAADLRLRLPMPDGLRGELELERDRLVACLN